MIDETNLTRIRTDFYDVLLSAPAEIQALRSAIIEGRINGSTYEGECACLVGTIANVAHCKYNELPKLKPNSIRAIERFFMSIKPGHTPENNQPSKLVLQWLDEFVEGAKLIAKHN